MLENIHSPRDLDDLSYDQLEELAKACYYEPVCTVTQKLDTPNNALYIGPGKADEIRMEAQILDADLVIFDDELSGKQIRNLEDRIGIKVIDRTALILDIFAQRALSEEGKLQVAAAQACCQGSAAASGPGAPAKHSWKWTAA